MKAWQLIEREENWCKEAMALDDEGCETWVNDPRACRWCPQGAIAKCYQVERERIIAHRDLSLGIRGRSIIKWNDASIRTHAQVLAAMRKADV